MATYSKKDFNGLESGAEFTVTAEINEGYGVEDVLKGVTEGSSPTVEPTGGESVTFTGTEVPGELNRRGEPNQRIMAGEIVFNGTEGQGDTNPNNYYIKARGIRFKVTADIADGKDTYGSVSVSGVGEDGGVPYNNDTAATVTATPKDPCTFAGWTRTGGGSTDIITPASPTAPTKSLTELKVDDVTMTADFNCAAAVVDYNGNVVQGGTTSWVEDNTIHVPNDRCCTLYKYPVTTTDLNNGKNGCNKNYFKSYAAYYEPLDGLDFYKPIYHARGWEGKYTAPQFGNNTTTNGLPVANDVMIYGKYGDGTGWHIVTQIPTINASNGYGAPSDSTVQLYSSSSTPNLYKMDGSPDMNYVWGVNNIYPCEYRGASNKWCMNNGSLFPRSTWLVLNNKTPLPVATDVSPMFDVSDLNEPNIHNIYDLVGPNSQQFIKNKNIWFELELRNINTNSSISGSDYFVTYFDGEVTISSNKITKLDNRYITDADPEYIAYYDANGVKKIYRKVVNERTFFKRTLNGTTLGSDTEQVLSGNFSSTIFNYQDGDCGVFNGWYTLEEGERQSVGNGNQSVTVSRPNSCCHRYYPDITSCSDKYYPYGFYGDVDGNAVYYRYALLPYVNTTNGSYITPSGSGVSVHNIDYTSIITNGLGGSGYDKRFFKLGPGETLYGNGLLLLQFVNSTGSNVGNYKVVDGKRKLQKLTTNENIKTYEEVGVIENTTNTDHYYRIGWIEVDTSLLDGNSLNFIGSYDNEQLAVNSGELFLVNNGPNFTYNGMFYSGGIVYKNSCTINKSAVVLTCPSTSDFSQRMSMEEKYVDDGVFETQDSTQKYKKQYTVIGTTDYGPTKNAIKYGDGNTSQMGTKLLNNFGITSSGTVHAAGAGNNTLEACDEFKYNGEKYGINYFDGGRFGFYCVNRVGVGEYLGSQWYDDPIQGLVYGNTVNNTTSGVYRNYNPSNPTEEENARRQNMVVGKFICDTRDPNIDNMVLLDSNNLNYYINNNGYISNNQPCWYSLYDGGIEYNGSDNTVVRLAKDNNPTYGLGHFMFGTDSSYTDTFGRWWPLTNSNVIDLCDDGAGETYHLVKNNSNYSSKRSYIRLSEVENGSLTAYYFSETDGWSRYDALPVLLDLSALDGDNEVWILRDVGENINREYGKTYILDTDSGNNNSYYIRPLNTQWPFNDAESTSDQMLVVQKFVGKELTGSKKYQLQINRYPEHSYNGSAWYYGDLYKVSNATDIINALKDEVRFVEAAESFIYDSVSYVENVVYKLYIEVTSETPPTRELHSGGEIEYALDNSEINVILVSDVNHVEEVTEFYCTLDGFDKHGFYIGIPGCRNSDGGGQYYGYDNTLLGYNGDGISYGLYKGIDCEELTCVDINNTRTVGTIYQPSVIICSDVTHATDSTYYQRVIQYNSEYSYYQITKYGYYVNNEFIEVPYNGYKKLRMADGGVKRRLLSDLIDNVTHTKETTTGYPFYSLGAPLELESDGTTLKQKSYDYVPYNGTPSTSTNVATVAQFLDARDINHTQFIHTTNDIYVHNYEYGNGACVRYPANRYYQLSSNYYKTIIPSNYGITDSGVIDLEFLGWLVESAPVYEFYCDAVGNADGSVVEYPIKDVYSIDVEENIIDTLGLGDYIVENFIETIYANNDYPFVESVSPLNDYSIVENETTLRACLNSSTPFKVESYDGNDIWIYENGKYYLPSSQLLTSAFKYHYPYLSVNTTGDYNETHFTDGKKYINSGVYSVIYTDNDVNRVLSYGLDFITIADYKKSSSPLSGAVNVSNVDDLKKCIANKAQNIHIVLGAEDINYKFMTYVNGEYYTRNSVSINGRTFYGGDVLMKTVESKFIPKEQNVKILGCETATAVYANSFFVEFCSIVDSCTNTSNTMTNIFNGLIQTYDGEAVTWLRSNSLTPGSSNNFKIDHRHFVGKHNLEFMRLDSYTTDNGTYVETTDFSGSGICARLVGYRVGTCMKTFTGDPIKTKPGAINDIRTFIYGVLPSCGENNPISPASSCDTKIITNNTPALFGQDSQTPYEYMLYDINIQYYWDVNDGCYKRYPDNQTPKIPQTVSTSEIYKTTLPWEDGAIALKNRVSNGLYRVTVKEYNGDTSSIDGIDLYDISSGKFDTISSLIMGFARYFKTGNYVDDINTSLENEGFKMVMKPQTVYCIDYLKTCSLEFTLVKNTDTLEVLLCVYDIDNSPFNLLGCGKYQLLNDVHWNGPINEFYDVRTTQELEDAIFNNRPVIRNISGNQLTYNDQTFESYGYESGGSIVVLNGSNIYGNIRYNDGFTNSAVFGHCKRPILKYISGVLPTLAAPSISRNGFGVVTITHSNTTATGVQIRYTDNGSTPTETSTLYAGPIQLVENSETTIKAICVASGYTKSTVTEKTYGWLESPSVTEIIS